MSESYRTPNRKRLYERRFDWDEARRRWLDGESQRDLAKEYGVSNGAVWYACHSPRRLTMKKTSETVEPQSLDVVLIDRARHRDRCPTCQGWKQVESKLCSECHKDARLGVPKLLRIKGAKRIILGGLDFGRIVLVDGRYGVVEADRSRNQRYRRVDFWDGPAERVRSTTVVDVLPSIKVVVEEAA